LCRQFLFRQSIRNRRTKFSSAFASQATTKQFHKQLLEIGFINSFTEPIHGGTVLATSEKKSKRGRVAGAIYFPRHSLKEALLIAETIWKDNAGDPYDRLSLAKSLDMSPTGSPFAQLLASSLRYGLTEGSYVSDKITLTSLGRSIVAPTAGTDAKVNLRASLLFPDIFRQIYNRFDKKPIPKEEVFKNTLQIDFKVPKQDVDACYKIITENMTDYSLAQDIKGTKYLQLDLLAPPSLKEEKVTEHKETEETPQPEELPVIKEKQAFKQIFVAHGKNKKPLEQLKTILTQFKVPFQVAIDEPHKGRPISEKVSQLMHDCTSGIFIFTADEETQDAQGNKILRPSDNVVFELGAGIVLYGQKIVIFREDGVSFGSDFTEYGHITFEKDKLDAKAFALMKELIGLGFLQVTPT
jgi:predicted nucleotide-binding protein